MSNSINSVVLVGNLGAAPEVAESRSGVTYAHLRLATNQRWKDGQGATHERTDWFRVVAFNGLAKTLTRLESGDRIAVQGRLQSGTYKDREGVKRTVIEIVATTVEFLRLKNRPAGEAAEAEVDYDPSLDSLGPDEDEEMPY